jgi:pimeloyl-ACP methyl ester carboxylesterase
VSGAEVFRKGLRNVKVVILDQCGHVPFFEKRPETVKIYKNFLAAVK